LQSSPALAAPSPSASPQERPDERRTPDRQRQPRERVELDRSRRHPLLAVRPRRRAHADRDGSQACLEAALRTVPPGVAYVLIHEIAANTHNAIAGVKREAQSGSPWCRDFRAELIRRASTSLRIGVDRDTHHLDPRIARRRVHHARGRNKCASASMSATAIFRRFAPSVTDFLMHICQAYPDIHHSQRAGCDVPTLVYIQSNSRGDIAGGRPSRKCGFGSRTVGLSGSEGPRRAVALSS